MKKILLSLVAVSLLFGCQKDKGSNSAVKPGIIAIKKIDSVVNTDTGLFQKPIHINDITCVQPNTVVAKRLAGTYVVIANFPISTAYPTVLIPTSQWTIANYTLVNQADGNMVLYKGTPAPATAIWKSDTYGSNRKFYLQTDLNMVAYVNGTAIWDTKTQSYRCTNHTFPEKLPQNMSLVLVNDGDLEIVADGVNGNGVLYTMILGGTRTYGGVNSPNNGKFFLDYTNGTGQTGVAFKY